MPAVAMLCGVGVLLTQIYWPKILTTPAVDSSNGANDVVVMYVDHFTPERSGSLQSRISNLINVFHQQTQSLQTAIFGFGPGSLVDWYRTGRKVQSLTDIGVIFHPGIETGLPAGILFILMLLRSTIDGFRSHDACARGLALGIACYSSIALSSADYAMNGPAVLMAALAESWSRIEKRATS